MKSYGNPLQFVAVMWHMQKFRGINNFWRHIWKDWNRKQQRKYKNSFITDNMFLLSAVFSFVFPDKQKCVLDRPPPRCPSRPSQLGPSVPGPWVLKSVITVWQPGNRLLTLWCGIKDTGARSATVAAPPWDTKEHKDNAAALWNHCSTD